MSDSDYIPESVAGIDDAATAGLTLDEDSTPFGHGSEVDGISFDTELLPDTDDEALSRTVFRPIPVGEHKCVILDVKFQGKNAVPVEERRKAIQSKVSIITPGGEVKGAEFWSQKIQVTYCLPGDERCTLNEFFTLPPLGNEKEKNAYWNGFIFESDALAYAKGDKTKTKGFEGQRLSFVLKRMGFNVVERGDRQILPPEAGILTNWIFYPVDLDPRPHRMIGLRVRPPKKGSDFNQIQNFSHFYVAPPPEVIRLLADREAAGSAIASPAHAAGSPPSTPGRHRRARQSV